MSRLDFQKDSLGSLVEDRLEWRRESSEVIKYDDQDD